VEFEGASLHPRDDITIVGVSNMAWSVFGAELLREAGIHAEVIDPISLMPLDSATIMESASRTRRLLVWTTHGPPVEQRRKFSRSCEAGGAREGIADGAHGIAPTTWSAEPSVEREFYPNPITIASKAYAMVHPDAPPWMPDPEHAALSYQLQFRGPFYSCLRIIGSTWAKKKSKPSKKCFMAPASPWGRSRGIQARVCDYFGMRHGIMVNSGSSADLAALPALFYKRERPLRAVTKPSCRRFREHDVPSAPAIRMKLASLTWNAITLNVDVSKLEAAVTPKSRLLVPSAFWEIPRAGTCETLPNPRALHA